jgi:S-formylglutathione hydrolase FrmB
MRLFSLLVLSLFIAFHHASGGTQHIISIQSSVMDKKFTAAVYVPDTDESKRFRYPVIYLLHGYAGDHTNWARIAPLNKFTDTYSVIFVCVDGGHHSWYLDSPVRPESQYETYIIDDVVPAIDSAFTTIASYTGRVLIGSSMGGHGALTLLAKHHDTFIGAGSISGIMDLTEFPRQWDIARVLGPMRTHRQRWIDHSVIGLLKKLVVVERPIVLDCGTADFALRGNRAAHHRMVEYGIPHQYCERPGTHSPRYVAAHFEFHLFYFSRFLKPIKNE